MLPLSLTRHLNLSDSNRLGERAFLTALAGRLTKAKSKDLEIRSDSLSFRAGVFRLVSNWNPLLAIHYGVVAVEAQDALLHVRYTLRFGQAFVFCLLLSGWFALMSSSVVFETNSVKDVLLVFMLVFGWLYGANILLADDRVRKMIRDSWRDVNEAEAIRS